MRALFLEVETEADVGGRLDWTGVPRGVPAASMGTRSRCPPGAPGDDGRGGDRGGRARAGRGARAVAHHAAVAARAGSGRARSARRSTCRWSPAACTRRSRPRRCWRRPGFDFVCLGEGEEALLELVEALEAGGADRRHRQPVEARRPRAAAAAAVRAARRPARSWPATCSTSRAASSTCPPSAAARSRAPTARRACTMSSTRASATTAAGAPTRTCSPSCRAARRRAGSATSSSSTTRSPSTTRWVQEFCRVYGERVRACRSRCTPAWRRSTRSAATSSPRPAASRSPTASRAAASACAARSCSRPVTNQRFHDVFRWTREAGILLTANYMLGLPGETRDDLERRWPSPRSCAVLDFGYFVFYPVPRHARSSPSAARSGYLPGRLPRAAGQPPRVDPAPAGFHQRRHRRVLRPLHRPARAEVRRALRHRRRR